MEQATLTFAELAAAAEQLPESQRLLLLERLVRSLRRELAGEPPVAAGAGSPPAAAPAETPLDDEALEELIAESLFEDLP